MTDSPSSDSIRNKQFLEQAFDADANPRLQRNAQVRRNLYVALFGVSMLCLLYSAWQSKRLASILSLILAALTLRAATFYTTRITFLRALKTRNPAQSPPDQPILE